MYSEYVTFNWAEGVECGCRNHQIFKVIKIILIIDKLKIV